MLHNIQINEDASDQDLFGSENGQDIKQEVKTKTSKVVQESEDEDADKNGQEEASDDDLFWVFIKMAYF